MIGSLVNITSTQANNSSSWNANGKTDRSEAKEEIINSKSITTQSSIISGGDLNIITNGNQTTNNQANNNQGDITIQAAKLKVGNSLSSQLPIDSENPEPIQSIQASNRESIGNITISSADNLFILTAKDITTSSETNKSKTTAFAQSIGNSGGINSRIIDNQIAANQINLSAQNVIYAEHNANNSFESSLQAKIQNLKAETILTNPISEIHQSWDQTNRGLTKTGQASIAIAATAIAVGTGGIGAGLSGAIITAGATTFATNTSIEQQSQSSLWHQTDEGSSGRGLLGGMLYGAVSGIVGEVVADASYQQ